VLLGFNVVKGLAVSASVFDMMKGCLEELWRHSLACSITASQIARILGEPDIEEIAVAGLLHDIGKVALWTKFPEDMQELVTHLDKGNNSLIDLEKEHLGMTHPEIGEQLAIQWNLPENLVEPIRYHHNPTLSKKHQRRTSIVHLANLIARGRGYTFSNDIFAPKLNKTCWNCLELTDEIIDNIMEEVLDNLGEIDDATF
jgi:putative nucleotidyltransferase with HDIG domain